MADRPVFRIDAGTLHDPYPMLAALRETDPIHRAPSGEIVVTRYDDVVKLLRDPRFGRAGMEERMKTAQGLTGKPLFVLPAMFADPPDHTRLRNVLNRAFTTKVVKVLAPMIERMTGELLDRVAGESSFDLVKALAYPLPISTICHLLGMPEADHERIHELAEAHAASLQAGRLRDETREIIERGDRVRSEWAEYFGRLAEERRRAPADDFVSGLVQAPDDPNRLTEYELRATLVGLLFAGHMTTADSIGTSVYSLLTNREQWDALVRDPKLVGGAVEESFRYQPAIQVFGRVALEDTVFEGVAIAKGTNVLAMAGGANRDPAHFADPDRFDITRDPNRHVTFGSGIHFCAGAALGRAQLEIVLRTLVARFPKLASTGEPPVFRPSIGFRGLTRLVVTPS